MRFFPLAFVLSFLFFTPAVPFPQSSPAVPAPAPHFAQRISLTGVSNAGKVSDHLFRGAQPNLEHISELKNAGITMIVDLRGEFRGKRERERQQAEALGIQFVSIPVSGFSPPTSQQLAQFFSVLRQSPHPTVFVHCAFGDDRTGVFVASYRIAFEHWSAEEALSEMLAFGFKRFWHPAMVAFIRGLPDRLQSDPVLKSALSEKASAPPASRNP
jgi:tyrosine-protein phosphatase SIW14